MASDLLLLAFFLLGFFVGGDGDTTVGRIAHDIMDDISHLLFQLVDKLLGIVFLMLDIAQLLLPDTSQFTALQELLTDEVDEFDACGCGDEAFALALDIVALEKGLDDRGAG